MNIGPEIQEDLDRIYPGFEVEKQAEYMFGRDSLSKITRKFPCYRGNRQEFTGIYRYIVLNRVVNKNGNSEATKVEVSSGDTNIDSLAIVYFNSMLKDSFYPAELRGEKVNSNISIVLPTQCPEQTKIDNGYGTIEERRVISGMEQKVAKALGEINEGEVTRRSHKTHRDRVEPSLSPKNQSSKAALLNNRLTRIENEFDERAHTDM